MIQPRATGKPNTPYTAYGAGHHAVQRARSGQPGSYRGKRQDSHRFSWSFPSGEAVAVLIADSNTDPFSVARKLVAALGT
jgi:hypothetical protein